MKRILAAGTMAAAVLSVAAQAQTPARLDASTAQAIIEGCRAHAAAKGQGHAIAVYDRGADPVAFLRMDGNGVGIAAFAMDKAKAAAMWGFSTEGMIDAVSETPGFGAAPGVVTVAGGLPVFSGDGKAFLGGVGVSGEAPQDDAACAEAGIAAAGLRSAPKN